MLNYAVALILSQSNTNLLQQVRTALKAPGPAWTATQVTGKALLYSVPHEYYFVFYPDGRYVQKFKGPIAETTGKDANTHWQIDRSRGVEKLDFEDRDLSLATSMALSSDWLSPDAPVTITASGNTLHLKMKPSGEEEVLKIDQTTGLPSEASIVASSGTVVFKLSDWRAAGDRKIPMHVDILTGGLTDTISGEEVSAFKGDESVVSLPNWKPDDIEFDASKPAAVEAKRAISGHILVHPLVNGKDVGWFILDSGAEVMIIDKKTADDLHVPSIGKEPITGVGGNSEGSMRPVDVFTLGPTTTKNLMFSDYDLTQIGQALGIKLAGIVGDDFFRRTVISIEWKGPVVEVFKRDGYTLPGGSWLPVRFSSGNPAIEATVDGAPKSWFRFDTGADDFLTLHTRFVKRWNLLEGKQTSASAASGAGGTIQTQSGKVKWFDLAGHHFEEPIVQFSTADKGAFAEPYLAGNIGQLAMAPFKVVLDFSGYRLALIPTKS